PVPRSPSPSWRGAPSSHSGGAVRPPTPGFGGGTAFGGVSSARGRDSSSPSRHPGSVSRSNIALSVVTKPLLFGEWVVDSGCSRHLTPHRELLHDYQPLHEPHHIIVANGGWIEAKGQGAWHQQQSCGYVQEGLQQWRLANMVRHNMVLGIDVNAAEFEQHANNSTLCELCIMGKQHRWLEPQHAGLSRPAQQVLELVHSDVCGPMEVAALDGNMYSASLLVDNNKLLAVTLIKQK
ncbi:hypothetical protein QJQ45_026802, partial [Haematococcus lacustris]